MCYVLFWSRCADCDIIISSNQGERKPLSQFPSRAFCRVACSPAPVSAVHPTRTPPAPAQTTNTPTPQAHVPPPSCVKAPAFAKNRCPAHVLKTTTINRCPSSYSPPLFWGAAPHAWPCQLLLRTHAPHGSKCTLASGVPPHFDPPTICRLTAVASLPRTRHADARHDGDHATPHHHHRPHPQPRQPRPQRCHHKPRATLCAHMHQRQLLL